MILNLITFDGSNEEELWGWLGDSYIQSEDVDIGDGVSHTRIKVKTHDGEMWIGVGDTLAKDANGTIRAPSKKWLEKNLVKIDNEDLG